MTPPIIADNKFCIIDVESTGLSTKTDQIVQLAMAQVDYGVQRFRTVVHVCPTVPIKPRAAEVHGLTENKLRLCPTFGAIAAEVVEFIGDRCLVGYNAAKFDAPMLTRQIEETRGRAPAWPVLDVLFWERRYGGTGRHSLGVAAERWGVPVAARHDALGDLRTCWGVFLQLASRYPELGTGELHAVLAQQAGRGECHADEL